MDVHIIPLRADCSVNEARRKIHQSVHGAAHGQWGLICRKIDVIGQPGMKMLHDLMSWPCTVISIMYTSSMLGDQTKNLLSTTALP